MIEEISELRQRLSAGDERMARIEGELAQNTALTKRLADDTSDLVDAFKAAKGAFKVLDFLGKVAKPFLWIGSACLALYSGWVQVKSAWPFR